MPADPYDLLGLPARFDLESARIRAAYLARAGAAHPDRAPGAPDPDRTTAALNEARRTLEDPERRADALLVRLGGPTREQDRTLPPALLAEMLEIREAIDAARAEAEAANRARAVARWIAWADEQRRAAIGEVGALFASLSSPPRPAELKAIRARLNAWRYVERLIEHLDAP